MKIWGVSRLQRASLGVQLVGLLLIAVIAAQAISIWLFHDERRHALLAVARDSLLMRSVSMVHLLEDTPPTLHEKILGASSSRFTSFWVSEDPTVTQTADTETEQRLQRYLGEQFTPARNVKIDLQTVSKSRFRAGPSDKRHFNTRDETVRARRLANRQIDLTLSIQLNDGAWFNVATDYRPPARALLPLVVQMLLTIAAIVLIVGLAVRRLARPLRDLASSAEKLGRGEALRPLDVDGPKEVRAVTHAFNDMQDRLTRFVSDRTRMLAAISHDLRTPITSLRLRAEFIDDDENRDRIIETLDEMAQMTEATLAFSRDEAAKEDAVKTDLFSLLDSLASDQQDLGHNVTISASEKITLSCRPLSLKRAMRNLMENGIRYGERSTVTLSKAGNEAVVSLRDNGAGIPSDRMSDVFEPFVRLEESRSEETGGIGLGLAISRSIVHAHGGTIELINHPEGGLEAIVRLPIDADA
ncbi:ATP-binding protein [Roseibium algae]|uniref:histidine kinase n=1 Tax=Roseibium algae TaxID=3123038 RepID=A0ABU8TI71_9HYPH